MAKNFSALLVFLIILLSGCGGLRQLQPGSENVHIYNSYPTQTCRFLGNISNSSVHDVVDLRASLQDLKIDSTNFLKNEGAKLGANVVVLVSHKSRELHRRYVRGNTKLTIIYVHTINAKAFRCASRRMDKSKMDNLQIEESPLSKPE